MFAHHDVQLPENLLPDDLSDLLCRLGHRIDRRNITRALEAADIPGVVPPASRACRWTIPRETLLDVTAAVLRRRELRAAGPAHMRLRPVEHYRLPAARLLLREPSLKPFVPLALRRRVAAEERERAEAARQRQRRREAEVNAKAASEKRWQRQQDDRLRDLAMLYFYSEARMAATAARFPVLNKVVIESAVFEEFLAAWPYPGARPAWWRAPPGVLEKAVELVRPWADGRVREQPELAHLLPAEVDYLQPWPWRADT